jgi:Xaa-Pro aminopeptidase
MNKNTDPVKKAFRSFSSLLRSHDLDAYLVTDLADMEYLTGFSCPGAKLLVPSGGGKGVFFVGRMNLSLARTMLSGREFVEPVGDILFTDISARMRELGIRRVGIKRVGMSAAAYEKMRRCARKVSFLDAPGIPDGLREIKSAMEIDRIRDVAGRTAALWRRIRRQVSPGMSEKDIALMVDIMVRENGCDNSFPTIAATGPNTAFPHAVPTGRRLEANELLLVDFGMRSGGYCSDLTRVYYKGRIDRKIRRLRDAVLCAQEAVISRIRPGVAIGTLVKTADEVFAKKDCSRYALHGPGHGIGLDVHEKPFLRADESSRLRAGMVFTVEPGLYIEGSGGVRVEDMVLVTPKGCEVLSA